MNQVFLVEKQGILRMWDKQPVTTDEWLPVISVDGIWCPQWFSVSQTQTSSWNPENWISLFKEGRRTALENRLGSSAVDARDFFLIFFNILVHEATASSY